MPYEVIKEFATSEGMHEQGDIIDSVEGCEHLQGTHWREVLPGEKAIYVPMGKSKGRAPRLEEIGNSDPAAEPKAIFDDAERVYQEGPIPPQAPPVEAEPAPATE